MLSRVAFTFLMLAAWAAISDAALNFTDASWIWSSDATAGGTKRFPVTSSAFRKSISKGLLALKLPTTIEILMTADDEYTLYVNGVQFGKGSDWKTSQYYCISPRLIDLDTVLGNRVVIAVNASNTVPNTPAGLIGVVKLNYLGGQSEQYVTDGTWNSSLSVPNGFEATNFDDSTWNRAVVEAKLASPQTPGNQNCSAASILPPVVCKRSTLLLQLPQ